MSSLRERFEEVAALLNSSRDELNSSVQLFEEVLASIRLGISAWHVEGRYAIGYSKHRGKKWRILIQDRHGSEDTKEWDTWLFAEAPVHLRVDTVSWLPNLLEKLLENSSVTLAKIQRASTEAQAYADAMLQAWEESKQ